MTEHHHKVFNSNDYMPKRFGLNYSPPQIIIEYLTPSTGKLYHHKMRLHKFTKDKNNAEIMKELYEKHQVYLDKKKISSEQLLRLIERLKQNFVPRKKQPKKLENKKEETKQQEIIKEAKKEVKKEIKIEEKKEIKKEEKKEDKSDDIEEDFDFGEVESEKSKEENKKEIEKPKEKEQEKKDEKKKNKMDDELEEEEEEYGFDEFEDEDLNKLNDSELNKKKAEMDIEFEKNNIKKGDAKFQYDIRKEFDHEQYAAEWDDDSY